MTNGQDVLIPVVLESLDTMNIEEMLLSARDLPKTSKAYTPLDDSIAKYVSEHLSDMNFVEKCGFFDKTHNESKVRGILDNAMLKDARLYDEWDTIYFYNRVPDKSEIQIFLENIVIERQIPKMTFDEKCLAWNSDPTERVKDCLDMSIVKDISEKIAEMDHPNEILDIWDITPNGTKAKTIIKEFVENLPDNIRSGYYRIDLDDIIDFD